MGLSTRLGLIMCVFMCVCVFVCLCLCAQKSHTEDTLSKLPDNLVYGQNTSDEVLEVLE